MGILILYILMDRSKDNLRNELIIFYMNYCRIPHHDGQKIKYICVDRKCGNASKIGK